MSIFAVVEGILLFFILILTIGSQTEERSSSVSMFVFLAIITLAIHVLNVSISIGRQYLKIPQNITVQEDGVQVDEYFYKMEDLALALQSVLIAVPGIFHFNA